ncbi:MAG TPA: PAS domain-containing protein [Ferrovibrio sp.]|uniref:PAS domain-containing protein n=1 Tax=Ferrovibrio sp. TaxID=1917215 RepID=UPI002ED4C9CE
MLDPDLGRLPQPAKGLLAYWNEHCPAGGLPDRSVFDPLSLRPYLGNLLIVDVEATAGAAASGQSERRFRYRLIGTDVAAMSGRDMTGRYFEDVYDPVALAEMRHCFGWVVDHRRPARIFGTFRHANRAFLGFDGMFLPVATDRGSIVAQVIGYIISNKS